MNILLINYNNPFKESGIVVLDLFRQFKKKGHNVKVLVNNYSNDYPEGIISMETFLQSLKRRFYYKLKFHFNIDLNFFKKIDHKYCIFELNEKRRPYKTTKILKRANINPELIIILFAKEFINSRNIFELYQKTQSNILWVMFDMAPFTGACHYAWECEGYKNNCGNCPGLYSSDPFDLTFKNLVYKKFYIEKTNIQIIAGSEWQYRQARESSLFKNKAIHKILISVNPDIFKPINKQHIRREIGIPVNKKVIFFGAVGLNSARKGMKYLLASLRNLYDEINRDIELKNNLFIVTAGNEFDKIEKNLPFEYKNLGLLDNTYGIASCYQAADIYICPSIEDSGPTMINQSLMCGTPVVSFMMGVALDLVETGKTGYLAKIKDSLDLAKGIYYVLKLKETDYNKMSENCRQLALSLYSPEVQIQQFENIIKSFNS